MRLSEMLSQAAGSDVDEDKTRKMSTELYKKMNKTESLLEQASSLMKQNAEDLDRLRSVAFRMLAPIKIKKIHDEVKLLYRLPTELDKLTRQFRQIHNGVLTEIPPRKRK